MLEAGGARRLRNEFFFSSPQLKRISLGSTRAKEATVRLGILALVLALASGGATIRAQGTPGLSFSHAPRVPSLRTYDFGKTAPTQQYAAQSGLTCPMPVFRTESANDDPMPVVGGGPTVPMPVARSGCWNPLDPQD